MGKKRRGNRKNNFSPLATTPEAAEKINKNQRLQEILQALGAEPTLYRKIGSHSYYGTGGDRWRSSTLRSYQTVTYQVTGGKRIDIGDLSQKELVNAGIRIVDQSWEEAQAAAEKQRRLRNAVRRAIETTRYEIVSFSKKSNTKGIRASRQGTLLQLRARPHDYGERVNVNGDFGGHRLRNMGGGYTSIRRVDQNKWVNMPAKFWSLQQDELCDFLAQFVTEEDLAQENKGECRDAI